MVASWEMAARVATGGSGSSVPSKNHGSGFERVKAEFKLQSLTDPNVAPHIRGWLANERRSCGDNPRKWLNPPVLDVDHTRNDVAHCRWQYIKDNRRRGAKSRAGGAWAGYEKLRTAHDPGRG